MAHHLDVPDLPRQSRHTAHVNADGDHRRRDVVVDHDGRLPVVDQGTESLIASAILKELRSLASTWITRDVAVGRPTSPASSIG